MAYQDPSLWSTWDNDHSRAISQHQLVPVVPIEPSTRPAGILPHKLVATKREAAALRVVHANSQPCPEKTAGPAGCASTEPSELQATPDPSVRCGVGRGRKICTACGKVVKSAVKQCEHCSFWFHPKSEPGSPSQDVHSTRQATRTPLGDAAEDGHSHRVTRQATKRASGEAPPASPASEQAPHELIQMATSERARTVTPVPGSAEGKARAVQQAGNVHKRRQSKEGQQPSKKAKTSHGSAPLPAPTGAYYKVFDPVKSAHYDHLSAVVSLRGSDVEYDSDDSGASHDIDFGLDPFALENEWPLLENEWQAAEPLFADLSEWDIADQYYAAPVVESRQQISSVPSEPWLWEADLLY